MQVKRFVAADMRRALELVRQELGPDAIILSSNRIPDGVELLTTMGSDTELQQLQQQPLDKMAMFSESPMESDGAWSQSAVAERVTSVKKQMNVPAIQAPVQSHLSSMVKSSKQLAEEIEQARARMFANRKAEESAREFMVGKNTRVNAGIPRYTNTTKKEETRVAPVKEDARFSGVSKAKNTGSVADRARSATAVNPGRSDRDDFAGSIADRARSATTANPKANSLRSEDFYRNESENAAKDSSRPVSSQVTIPPRRVPVPRPVLVEKKQPPVKPKHQMTAAERYPLIDDEPEEIVTPELMQQVVQQAVQQAVEQAVEQVVQRQAAIVEAVVTPVAPVTPVAATETEVEPVVASNAPVVETEATIVSANVQAAEAELANSKYLLSLQSELADMRSLLEQQFSRLQQVNTPVAVVSETNATSASDTTHTVETASVTDAIITETEAEAADTVDTVDEEITPVTLSLDAVVDDQDIPAIVTAEEDAKSSSANSSDAKTETAKDDKDAYLLELQSELADMKFLLEQQFSRMSETELPMSSSSVIGGITRRLGRAGLPEDVVNKVVNSCTKTGSINEAWPEALATLARQVPVLDRDIVDEGGIFAFVGPTGVGKTTTIGKLAARYVLKHGADKVALITTDTYRIASHEQLRSIARILNVSVNVVDENNSLESLLKNLSHCAVVLIDTAGFRHGDPQLKAQLSSLSALPQIKTYVVLSTTCQAQMLKASVHAHGEARLQGCVLTKLDETSSLGEALGVVIKGWLPVAYTTDGQDIPADIDVARAHNLVSKAIAMIKKNAVSAVS